MHATTSATNSRATVRHVRPERLYVIRFPPCKLTRRDGRHAQLQPVWVVAMRSHLPPLTPKTCNPQTTRASSASKGSMQVRRMARSGRASHNMDLTNPSHTVRAVGLPQPTEATPAKCSGRF